MVLDRPCKLKDLAMKSSYYRLLNTFCIFTNSHWIFCQCDQYQGCQSKPVNGMLADKSYCYICHVGVIYVEERNKNLRKIADVYNNFLNIKEHIQLCIDFDSTCDRFWMYHFKTSYKTRFGDCKWRYLKNYIDECDYFICWNDQ